MLWFNSTDLEWEEGKFEILLAEVQMYTCAERPSTFAKRYQTVTRPISPSSITNFVILYKSVAIVIGRDNNIP